MTTLYHNPRCTTSRKALAKLEDSGIEYDVVLYLRVPPDKVTLEQLLARIEDPAAHLIRRDRRFEDLGLDPAGYTTSREVINLLSAHPELMQRPVIDDGIRAFIGRPLDRVDAFTVS